MTGCGSRDSQPVFFVCIISFFTQIPPLSPCEIPFLLMKPNIVRSERNFLLM